MHGETVKCNLVFLLSISYTFSYPYGQPVAAYVFFLVFPSLQFLPLPFLE
jgi:hypothetical protein